MATWTFARTVPALREDYHAVVAYCDETMYPKEDDAVQRRLKLLHTQFKALSESDRTSEDGKQLEADIAALSKRCGKEEEKAAAGGAGAGAGGAGKGKRKLRKSRNQRKRRNQTRRKTSNLRKS
jgi:hypothetical protein